MVAFSTEFVAANPVIMALCVAGAVVAIISYAVKKLSKAGR
jgi:hypothetical protein